MSRYKVRKFRPRSFWLRGLRVCILFLAIEIVALASAVFYVSIPGEETSEPLKFISVHDAPLMNYPEYRRLMIDGFVVVTRDGDTQIFYKDGFSARGLRELGLALRAE